MERIISNPGTPVKPVYAPIVNDLGITEVVIVGEENLQDEIESYVEATDINNIVARYTAGDDSALNAVHGTYGDFTNLPSTYAESLNIMINAKRDFESLPVSVKQQFDNNYMKFLSEANTDPDSFASHLGIKRDVVDEVADKVIDKIDKEVIKNEQIS